MSLSKSRVKRFVKKNKKLMIFIGVLVIVLIFGAVAK